MGLAADLSAAICGALGNISIRNGECSPSMVSVVSRRAEAEAAAATAATTAL